MTSGYALWAAVAIIRACADRQGKSLAGFAGQLAVHQGIDIERDRVRQRGQRRRGVWPRPQQLRDLAAYPAVPLSRQLVLPGPALQPGHPHREREDSREHVLGGDTAQRQARAEHRGQLQRRPGGALQIAALCAAGRSGTPCLTSRSRSASRTRGMREPRYTNSIRPRWRKAVDVAPGGVQPAGCRLDLEKT
jgi:hypothetical protein